MSLTLKGLDQELKKNIMKDLIDESNSYGRRREIDLNNEELEALGKLTAVRGLPFDPDKRLYRRSEVPGYPVPWLFERTF